MAVPYTFGAATAAIPLSQLDSNFASTITLGNTAIQLGNTVTILNNMTFANVTISSGSVTITNVTASGNVTISGGTANGVAYLNGSKVLTTGSALVFDGTNLGVGVTPSAWSALKAIQLPNAISLSSFSGGATPNAYLSTNIYFDGSNWVFNGNYGASRYEQVSGQHQWFGISSGTASGTATLPQLMTLDASGRLGVGVTSPLEKLQVAGAVLSSGQLQDLRASTLAIDYNTSDAVGRIVATGVNSSTYAPIVFASTTTTTYAERARIDSSGRLLVNTPTASGSIATFKGSQQSFIIRNGVNSDYNEFGVWDGASDQCKAVIKNEGGVAKFGTRTNNNVGIQVNDSVVATFSGSLGTGLVYTNGGVFTSTNPSDERLKSNIENLSWGLDSILALRPVSYTWNNDAANQGKQYGFIAQEVQTVMPELVREFETTAGEEKVTRFGLEKEGIYVAMVKAIQEQQAIITQLTDRITALEAK